MERLLDSVFGAGSGAPEVGTPEQNPTGPIEEDTPVRVWACIYDYGVGLENATLEYSTDDGGSWNPVPMSYNGTLDSWEAVIPGQITGTIVNYRIVAFDLAENMQVEDNAGSYYVYDVIPEIVSSLLTMLLLASLTTLAFTKARRKR